MLSVVVVGVVAAYPGPFGPDQASFSPEFAGWGAGGAVGFIWDPGGLEGGRGGMRLLSTTTRGVGRVVVGVGVIATTGFNVVGATAVRWALSPRGDGLRALRERHCRPRKERGTYSQSLATGFGD